MIVAEVVVARSLGFERPGGGFEWIFIDFPQVAFRLLLRFTRLTRVLVTIVTFEWRQHYEFHSGEVSFVNNTIRSRTPGFANFAFVFLLRITPSRRILVTVSISLKPAFVYVLRLAPGCRMLTTFFLGGWRAARVVCLKRPDNTIERIPNVSANAEGPGILPEFCSHGPEIVRSGIQQI